MSIDAPTANSQPSSPAAKIKAIPDAAHNLKGWRHFAGLFGGEHIAATEFIIGTTFVTMGVGAYEVLVGLAIGNALAVLSWALLTAPIAVQTRLSLYAYLDRIAGPLVSKLFNLANVLYYGALAAAMITVASFAIRFVFSIPVQLNWYPESMAFVVIVLVVAAIAVLIASLGFELLADVATICAPWMFICFLCGAFVTLPALSVATGGDYLVSSWGEFQSVAASAIWTGTRPNGSPGIGVWEVAGFAWANLAMVHIGLIDMALFRFARKASYGFFSAIGMFLGHYVAWIAAGIMGAGAAVVAGVSLPKLDAGDVAFYALGITGVVVVLVAGITTANSCLYRAGLAAANVFPRFSRSKLTMAVGVLVAIAACFPIVAQSVLPMTVYGSLLLAPIGAIVVAEHWIFPRLGLTRYWVSYRKLGISWPALLAWGIGLVFSAIMVATQAMSFYFIFLPEYLLVGLAYVGLASLSGAQQRFPKAEAKQDQREQQLANFEARQEQKETDIEPAPASVGSRGLFTLSLVALGVLLISSIWVYLAADAFGYESHRNTFNLIAVAATLVYFLAAALALWVRGRDMRNADTAEQASRTTAMLP